MRRWLAIVSVGALLCVFGAWLWTRRIAPDRSGATPPTAQPSPLKSVADVGPLDASTSSVVPRAVRRDLTALEPVALRFKGPAATLSVEVVDARAKLPVADVAVEVFESNSQDFLSQAGDPPLTDASGRLALRVPADRPLVVRASGTSLRTELGCQEVPALAQGEARSVRLEVAVEGDLHFFAKVVDGGTRAPLADVEIKLERRPSIEPITVSDAHGLFELRTNSWESRKATAARRGYTPLDFEVWDEHDAPARALELALTPAATVEGYYRDFDDKPATDGSLRFWTSSGFAAHIYPREDGWFHADSLPTGETLYVDLDLQHRPITKSAESFVLAPGEVRRLDCKLPPRVVLNGVLLDELGAPVQGGELALYFGNATDLHCLAPRTGLDERDNCTTDSEGRFTFSMAGEGDWVVALLYVSGTGRFLRPRDSTRILLAAENITISGGKSAELVLHCWRHTTIEGRVVDQEAHPISRAVLRVTPAGCDANSECWVNKDGTFRVLVPGPGTFEIGVEVDDRFLPPEKTSARAGEHDVVIRLKRAPLLRLRVIDEQSRKPVRAQIFGIGASGAEVQIDPLLVGEDPNVMESPCKADTYRLFARTLNGRCGTLEGVRVDGEPSTLTVAPGRTVLLRSSNATGPLEVELKWNGIPIGEEQIAKGSQILLQVPPGTLTARYRPEDSEGEWLTLDTPIDDANPTDIDLRFH